jgi:hypothetical protein
MGKVWKYFKFCAGLFSLAFGLFLLLLMILTLSDSKLLEDTININRISVTLGALSLPSMFLGIEQIFSTTNKGYIGTIKCPHCTNTAQIELTEKQ